MRTKLRIIEKTKLPFLCVGMLLTLVIFVSISGCLNSGSKTPTTTISYNIVVPTDTSPIPTIVIKPTLIDFKGNNGWERYTNYDDHFSIYRPSTWTVSAIDSSKIFGENSQYMKKVVYIFTPNSKGFIMIYGMDFSGTLLSIFNDPSKTQISDEFYDEFVKGIKSGETDKVKFTSLEKDSNYYLINGNPARRVMVYSQMNGQSLNGDFYMIAHENSYYVEGYFAMAGSTQSDASTASNIMRSFTTTT